MKDKQAFIDYMTKHYAFSENTIDLGGAMLDSEACPGVIVRVPMVRRLPTLKQITGWIDQSKSLPRMIFY